MTLLVNYLPCEFLPLKDNANESLKKFDHLWLLDISSAKKGTSSLTHPSVLAVFRQYFPSHVIFGKKDGQKPFVFSPSSPNFYFNISHSQGMALLAISSSYELGVDVENIVPRKYYKNIAKKYFRENIASLEQFYFAFTFRESIIKSKGEKLANNLSNIVVEQASKEHKVEHFKIGEQAIAAVCRPLSTNRSWQFFK